MPLSAVCSPVSITERDEVHMVAGHWWLVKVTPCLLQPLVARQRQAGRPAVGEAFLVGEDEQDVGAAARRLRRRRRCLRARRPDQRGQQRGADSGRARLEKTTPTARRSGSNLIVHDRIPSPRSHPQLPAELVRENENPC